MRRTGTTAAATKTHLAYGPCWASAGTLNQRKTSSGISRNQRTHQRPWAFPEKRPFQSSCSGSIAALTGDWRGCGAGAAGGAPPWIDAPHLLQNTLPAGSSALHLGQDI